MVRYASRELAALGKRNIVAAYDGVLKADVVRAHNVAKNPAADPVVLRGEDAIDAVGISPDNHWLVTGSDDKTARLWLLQVNDLMNLARITGGRNFSADEWRLYFSSEKYRKTFDGITGPEESATPKNN